MPAAVLSQYDMSDDDTVDEGADDDGTNNEVADNEGLSDSPTKEEAVEWGAGARIDGAAYSVPMEGGAYDNGIDKEVAELDVLYDNPSGKGALVPVPMERHTPDPRARWRMPRPTPPSGELRSTRLRAARLTRTAYLGMAVMDSVTVWLGSKPPWPCQDPWPLALRSLHRPAKPPRKR